MAPATDNSTCCSSNAFFRDKTFFAFFLLMAASVLYSSTANGLLLYKMVRYRQLLRQPQYILVKNLSASAIGVVFIIVIIVLFSVVYAPSRIPRSWCIAQFSLIRCFFLTYQLTLASMAIERYIFICRGIHYLRIVNGRNACAGVGLIWLLSAAVSLHGGAMLRTLRRGFPEHVEEPFCHAIALRDRVRFSREDDVLVFGPPFLLMSLCVSVTCYCYKCMHSAALRVTEALKSDNHRANFTVGFYLFTYLLQLLPNIIFIGLTLTREGKGTSRQTTTLLVIPFFMTVPLCVNVTFIIGRNPLLKNLVLCRTRRQELAAAVSGMCLQQRIKRREQGSTCVNMKSEV